MGSIDLLTIIQITALALLLVIGLEIILRHKGFEPKTFTKEKSTIVPEGKLYQSDPKLGFVFQPGNFSISINNRFTFTANHDENGHRITSDKKEYDQNTNYPEIWFLGCSFTYGWLVYDNETFPWLVQQHLKNWKVRNFGVSGYSILQSYLQFKEASLKGEPPRIVMLMYGSEIHDNRNTLTRKRKKSFTRLERTSPFSVPCGRLTANGDLKIIYDHTRYTGLPFSSYSALMHRLENKYDMRYDSRLNNKEVSKKIITKFQLLCDKVNSTFILAGIHEGKNTKKMLQFCNSKGIKTLDISVDRGPRYPEHSFYPFDDHPSPLAHKKYAETIIMYLKQENLINTQSVKTTHWE
ncbi:SGNH/GDSL hydrolase family protein [Fodinibius saliphilus]|uniref:SGNH/GDSL hydrolase family protein n=1 Tax=Fodinibius saliphilus TaxID=1920650 RepID=UPI001108F25D|nr:SGNH/GDSL hydrolase family protein [Fodinibius saliphilus]